MNNDTSDNDTSDQTNAPTVLSEIAVDSAVQTFNVPGMSCGHCVAAITQELNSVAGVDAVDVNLETKLVSVSGTVSESAIIEAIDEAGYEVVR